MVILLLVIEPDSSIVHALLTARSLIKHQSAVDNSPETSISTSFNACKNRHKTTEYVA